ncbi:hypothetical protein ACGFNV_10195 [Streptomyces sp. NPDC048751]|uniref:hypothetical protein n=1 Tax=Streptomyces sp. NPDC048751 TaxID=3365591 RepID=UPI0037122F49
MTTPDPAGFGRFPTLGDYSTALQHPQLCFPDDADLRTARVTGDVLLGPMASSGNFGGVYHLVSESGQREWGVKCFTRASDIRPERYRSICARLADVDPDTDRWYVPVQFLPEGIRVGENRWPVTKMTWIRAPGLIDWIDQNVHNSTYLRKLASDFTDVVLRLEELGIAHGDLQHGNVLVSAGRRVRLVDYDAMYVPDLAGAARPEGGHRHYQHPRAVDLFGPRMDRFPARVIQLSLLALAHDPDLWTELREPEDERLLLGMGDFADPNTSEAFDVLSHSSDFRVLGLVARLLQDLDSDPDDIPPLARLRPDAPLSGRGQAAQTRPVPASTPPPPPSPPSPPFPPVPPAFGTEATGVRRDERRTTSTNGGDRPVPARTNTPQPVQRLPTPSRPSGTDDTAPARPGPAPVPRAPAKRAAPEIPGKKAAERAARRQKGVLVLTAVIALAMVAFVLIGVLAPAAIPDVLCKPLPYACARAGSPTPSSTP